METPVKILVEAWFNIPNLARIGLGEVLRFGFSDSTSFGVRADLVVYTGSGFGGGFNGIYIFFLTRSTW